MKKNSVKEEKTSGAGRRAVVDIGSNSVRLVIFDGPARAPMAICNEKALCGLGRDMKLPKLTPTEPMMLP